jgi:hypothetical protein
LFSKIIRPTAPGGLTDNCCIAMMTGGIRENRMPLNVIHLCPVIIYSLILTINLLEDLNIIAPLGLNIVCDLYFYKDCRGSAAGYKEKFIRQSARSGRTGRWVGKIAHRNHVNKCSFSGREIEKYDVLYLFEALSKGNFYHSLPEIFIRIPAKLLRILEKPLRIINKWTNQKNNLRKG